MTLNSLAVIIFGTFVSTSFIHCQLNSVCQTSTEDAEICDHSCVSSTGCTSYQGQQSSVSNATESACSDNSNGTNIVCSPSNAKFDAAPTVAHHERELIEKFDVDVGPCGQKNLRAAKGFPWSAQIFHKLLNNRSESHCGGVLISQRHVLTTAHCVDLIALRVFNVLAVSFVRFGEWNKTLQVNCDQLSCNDPVVDASIARIVIHRGYNRRSISRENDIALVELQSAIMYSDGVSPICLPISIETRNRTYERRRATVTGWIEDSRKDVVQTIDFEITPLDECAETYRAAGAAITGIHICAQTIVTNASDVQMCRGFSGSPLMIRENRPHSTWFLVGIVAYGPALCDLDEWPFVSTRVDKYIEWILQNVL